MRIEEVTNTGLNREYKVVVEAADVEKKIESQLEDMKTKIRLPGFRPGKAPTSLLRKMHGQSIMGQVLEELVNENTKALMEEKEISPAAQPSVEIIAFEEASDLEYKIAVEVLPEVAQPDIKKIKLERLVAKATDKEIDEALDKIAEQQKRFDGAAASYKAKSGDLVVINFAGSVDGELFPGGTAEDHQLELGSGNFIPGFEDQLIGTKADDERDVNVTFPAEYQAEELAGKDAVFKVLVKEVKKPAKTKIDDELATAMGLEDLAQLKENVGQQLQQELDNVSGSILKRRLLDQLADMCVFEVPASMVDVEFAQIWQQIKMDLVQSGEATVEALEEMDGPEDPDDRADYMNIAERRVRLGLVLSEVGKAREVAISNDEVQRQIMQEARRYPGQEKEVFDFYTKNEGAMAQLRAPIYEQKVCELILGEAAVKEKTVSRDALQKALESLDEEDEAPKAKKTAKKPAAKAKTAAKPKAAAKPKKAAAKPKPKAAAKAKAKK